MLHLQVPLMHPSQFPNQTHKPSCIQIRALTSSFVFISHDNPKVQSAMHRCITRATPGPPASTGARAHHVFPSTNKTIDLNKENNIAPGPADMSAVRILELPGRYIPGYNCKLHHNHVALALVQREAPGNRDLVGHESQCTDKSRPSTAWRSRPTCI